MAVPEEKDAPDVRETPDAAALPPMSAHAEPDAAHESLAAALRVSFVVLKLVILFMVIGYFVSGLYIVDQDEVAIALRFGKIAEIGGQELVKGPGLHINWPAPVGEVVRISTGVRSLGVNTFWPQVSESEREQGAGDRQKRPEEMRKRAVGRAFEGAENAYLMTGDLTRLISEDPTGARVRREAPAPNLLQARFTVRYQVLKWTARDYFENVKDDEAEVRLVKYCLESAAVRESARLKVYDVLKDMTQIFRSRVQRALQEGLKQARSGIKVISVSMADPVPPKSVAGSFRDVLAAQQGMRSLSESAKAYKSELLRRSAGEVGGEMGDAILSLWDLEDRYAAADYERQQAEKAGRLKPLPDAERQAQEEIRKAKRDTLRKKIEGLFARAAGDVRRITEDANAYAKRVKERAEGLAQRVTNILDKYRGQPEFLEILRLEAITDLLANAYEKFYVTKKRSGQREVRLIIGRNPEVVKEQRKVKDAR